MALQTPKFYLAGSKRARKSGFLRTIDRKNPQFEQALKYFLAIPAEPKKKNRHGPASLPSNSAGRRKPNAAARRHATGDKAKGPAAR
ncbi:MAG: hypothetical protein LBD18_01305 [Treponema sp.]|nr:hypothetical protein [Treponema sp.]